MDLSGWIAGWARQTPDKVAIRHEGGDLTYAEFHRLIQRRAAWLEHGLGLQPGDRIAHLGESTLEQLVLFFACARIGAMQVTLNWRLAPPEHLYQLQDAEPKALFADEMFHAHVGEIRGDLRNMRFFTTLPSSDLIRGPRHTSDQPENTESRGLGSSPRAERVIGHPSAKATRRSQPPRLATTHRCCWSTHPARRVGLKGRY